MRKGGTVVVMKMTTDSHSSLKDSFVPRTWKGEQLLALSGLVVTSGILQGSLHGLILSNPRSDGHKIAGRFLQLPAFSLSG
jgi:hypothetical protein